MHFAIAFPPPPPPAQRTCTTRPSSSSSSFVSSRSRPSRNALERLKAHFKPSAQPTELGTLHDTTSRSGSAPLPGRDSQQPLTLQHLNLKAEARAITDPRSIEYKAKKYSVSETSSLISRPRRSSYQVSPPTPAKTPDTNYPPTVHQAPSTTTYISPIRQPAPSPIRPPTSSAASYIRPATASSPSVRPATSGSTYSTYTSNMGLYRTSSSASRGTSIRSSTKTVPKNPVSTWDDDEEESPKKRGLFRNLRRSKPHPKAPKAKPVSMDTIGDFEWNVGGYMEGDEEDRSDEEIESALRRVREITEAASIASQSEKSEHSELSELSELSGRPRTASTGSASTQQSRRISQVNALKIANPKRLSIPHHLPPISPAQSLDLSLERSTSIGTDAYANERFENEVSSLTPPKPAASPNYAREHISNRLRKYPSPATAAPTTPLPAPPRQVPEDITDSWNMSSRLAYQITPPDSTRNSHVDTYHDPHHSMVLPESPIQHSELHQTRSNSSSTSSSSSSSDRSKWDDISANIALIQQQIQEMSPRSRELARGFAARELVQAGPQLRSPATLAPTHTPPIRPSRDNVELPDFLQNRYVTMTSSPSVRPTPRRKLGPSLEEDMSPESSQRSSVSTRLSTAPSSPEPDMRSFQPSTPRMSKSGSGREPFTPRGACV